MRYLICVFFFVAFVLFLFPSYHENYTKVKQPNIPTKTIVTVSKKTVKIHKNSSKSFKTPPGEALDLITYVSHETGYSVVLLSKIAKAESGYVLTATHLNKNKSIDYGLFQINSCHLKESQKMGLDIANKPKDNAIFTVYLIKKYGLSPWIYSQNKWL